MGKGPQRTFHKIKEILTKQATTVLEVQVKRIRGCECRPGLKILQKARVDQSSAMCDAGGEQADLKKKYLRDAVQARKDVYMHLALSIYSIWVLGFRVLYDTRYYLHLGLFIFSSLNLGFRALDPILTLVKKKECQKTC
jgi:hypothetical protein